jgi:tetratricopeptide (TPR) repeat protein
MSRAGIDQKYQNLVTECDLRIKAGQINQVILTLSNLVIRQVPRSARQGLASCCRRVGLIGLGLRLLDPILRAQKFLDEPPTAGEECEFSVLLARNGSVQEALELLHKVDSNRAPEALLYRGHCHILNWEYSEAIGCFKKFLSSSADEYSKLTARVNLISAYVVLFRMKEATDLLKETEELAQKAGAQRLLANCYELWGQIYFWENDFSGARRLLERAAEILDNSQSGDQLLILKTESIMNALELHSVNPLIQFRSMALQRKYWESVREADFFMLKIAQNQKQLDHLYFGTPKAAYRRRIEMLLGMRPSESYVLGSEKGPQLNLQTGLVTGVEGLPLGKQVHQVISTLIRDFYAPISLGTLFYELYPDEYFDMETSPGRIRQAILRTRDWLQNHKIPALIRQSQGTYRFLITGDFGIRIERGSQQAVTPTLARWEQLKELFRPGVYFSSEQACQQLGWSRTTFRRVVDWACENERMSRSGAGKATVYQIRRARRLDHLIKGPP